MKQTLGIGSVVDDGTGDYLRLGGQKINNNFNEIYDKLGDGQVPHPAGAWKVHTVTGSTGTINAEFGQSYSINTTSGECRVVLPRGTSQDYGKVIKIRDVWGTWAQNNVLVTPSSPNTIKGGTTTKKMYRDYQDVELVFVSPGNWDYLDNKLVGRLSSSDVATVSKKEFIATANQRDFSNIFGETPYNIKNIEVYRRGNLMYYGDTLTADSDYGSIDSTNSTNLVALDGKTIRLRTPCNAGDIITIITYLDDLAVYKTSYMSRTIKVYGSEYENAIDPTDGQQWVGDLATKRVWTLNDFGLLGSDGHINPWACEVLINGRNLTKSGEGAMPAFACEDSNGVAQDQFASESSCQAAGYVWAESGMDFSVLKDTSGLYTQLKIREQLDSGDILTVKWFNNDIGSTMSWDAIKAEADEVYLNNEYRFTRQNTIRYNEYGNVNPCVAEKELTVETDVKVSDVSVFFDLIYPIGTIYENAHNTANPADYMGFGIWEPYGGGRVVVGWVDGDDPNFSYYDGTCGRMKSPGGIGGNVEHEIQRGEMPSIVSNNEVLIKDDNGDILIGQCLLDPDDGGPGYRKYREATLESNVGSGGINLSLLQPFITAARWVRVA